MVFHQNAGSKNIAGPAKNGISMLNRLRSVPPGRWSWVWLLAGFLLLPFSAWQNVIPLAAWLAPVFLLRFSRTCEKRRAVIPLVVLAYMLAILLDWRNGPGDALSVAVGIGTSLARGILYMLPYLADGLSGKRLPAWGRMMVFPLAYTGVDWATSWLRPITTHGSLAYSQYPLLVLVQIVSITGMWGVTFLITWVASAVNYMWEESFHWHAVRWKLLTVAAVAAGVFLFGAVRLSLPAGWLSAAPLRTVRIAAVTNETVFDPLLSMDLGTFFRSTDSERAAVRPKFQVVNDIVFGRVETALQGGARIVVTQETAGLALEEDLPVVVDRASDLAKQYRAYLAMALWVFSRTQSLPFIHNQVFLIDPDGGVAAVYEKSYPVFGSENFIVFSGSGALPLVDTSFGRMSAAICNDLNFPKLLLRTGAGNVDVLIAPFNDDPEISVQNPAEAAFRTVENGVTTIRAAGRGPSMVIDPLGRTVASQDYFASDSHILLADVPIYSVRTVYSRVGDVFAYLSIGGLAVLFGFALFQRKRSG
jgi:apolipoprotein N-acyltransferase